MFSMVPSCTTWWSTTMDAMKVVYLTRLGIGANLRRLGLLLVPCRLHRVACRHYIATTASKNINQSREVCAGVPAK